jgi:hypothetical protein
MYYSQRTRLGDVAVFENRQTVTAAKFITKSSLFILLLGVIRRLENYTSFFLQKQEAVYNNLFILISL